MQREHAKHTYTSVERRLDLDSEGKLLLVCFVGVCRLGKDFTQKFLAYYRLPLPHLNALQPLHRWLTLRAVAWEAAHRALLQHLGDT